jgi:hypothetical protein
LNNNPVIKMEKLFIIILLLNFGICFGQTKSENKLVSKIDKQILSKKLIKKELFKELGWAGGYEKLTIYLKNNTPILIEKEEKQVKHNYSDRGEYNEIMIFNAKFYIINWKENKFFRIGTYQNSVNKKSVMSKDLIFTFDKNQIEQEIKNGL